MQLWPRCVLSECFVVSLKIYFAVFWVDSPTLADASAVWTKWEPWPVVCYWMSLSRPGKTRPQWRVVALTNHALTEASFLCGKTNILGMLVVRYALSPLGSFHLSFSFSQPLSDPVLFCPFQRAWLILIQLAGWSHISLDKLSGPQQQQLKVLLLFFNHSLSCPLVYLFCLTFLSLSSFVF